MNKKLFLGFFVLLASCFCLPAEQRTYYVNHKSLPSLTILREANVKENKYEYYIENERGRKIYNEKEASVNFDFVREFIASEDDYSQADKISITWDFKEDDGTELKDGNYSLVLREINRKNQAKSIRHDYTICLDSKEPVIFPSLTKRNVFKNKAEDLTVIMNTNSEKANLWRVVLDDQHVLYESDLSENEMISFPVGVGLSYEEYRRLSEGTHEIKVIARDCAGNTTEKQMFFEIGQYPLKLSVFSSSDGVTYNLDGTVLPFRYIGTGISGVFWETTIEDSFGNIHFSQQQKTEFDATCPPFVWDGVSSATGSKVAEGKYNAQIKCRDTAGNELSGLVSFYVGTEKIIDENYGKPPFLSGRYANGEFILELINYKGKISSAVLTVNKDNQILHEIPVDDLSMIAWNGTDSHGDFILSTWEDYDFCVQLTNGKGEQEFFKTNIRTPLVCDMESGGKQQVKVDSIYFDANNCEIFTENDFFLKNSQALRKIANALLLQMNETDVLIVSGNANYTTYPHKNLMRKENEELVQLSMERAEIVKKILVFYGLQEDKILVAANGGENYKVPPNSLENWKNRRVEFFIQTKGEQ